MTDPIERLKRARERYGSLLSVDRGSVEMAAIYLESQFGFPVDGKSMMEEMKVSALARKRLAAGQSVVSLAKHFGVSKKTIIIIRQGKRYAA